MLSRNRKPQVRSPTECKVGHILILVQSIQFSSKGGVRDARAGSFSPQLRRHRHEISGLRLEIRLEISSHPCCGESEAVSRPSSAPASRPPALFPTSISFSKGSLLEPVPRFCWFGRRSVWFRLARIGWFGLVRFGLVWLTRTRKSKRRGVQQK